MPRAVARKRARRENRLFFLYISPWIIGFLAFTILPMILSMVFSFTDVSMVNAGEGNLHFIGWENYARIFTQDDDFKVAIGNTFAYAVIKVFLLVFFALLVSLMLNANVPARKLFRVMIYLPAIIPSVSVALLWKLIFTGGEFNIANYFLSYLGFQPVNFFGNGTSAMGTLIFIGIWSGLGPQMLVLLAALQNVPKDLLEASYLDGANAVQRFFHIIIPCIAPALVFAVLTGLIGAFQVYVEPHLLTGGGPGISTTTTSMLIVANAFKTIGSKRLGYASAQGWIVFTITLVPTAVYFLYSRRKQKI